MAMAAAAVALYANNKAAILLPQRPPPAPPNKPSPASQGSQPNGPLKGPLALIKDPLEDTRLVSKVPGLKDEWP